MNPSRNEVPPILGNPFFHRGPIRDRRYFFGRVEETRRALGMLRNSQCVSIVGPRRIGETSFLFHLCDPEVQGEHSLGQEYLFVYIDCQGLGDLGKSQLYHWLWQETKRALAEREKADASVQRSDATSAQEAQERELLTRLHRLLVAHFDAGELRTLCFDLGIDYDDLRGDGKANKARELIASLEHRDRIPELLRIGKQLRPDVAWGESTSGFSGFREAIIEIQKKGYKPVYLFDEFEAIAVNPYLDEDLFSDLRSLVPGVVYVTASQDSLYDLTYADRSVLSSPFFNVFFETRLGFLEPKEAEEMVWGLLRMTGREHLFTKANLDFVFELGGYFPFFIQLACYHLFEHKTECKELAVANDESVRQQYTDDAEPHFRYAWKNLDASQQKAVQMVVEGKISQLDDEQRRQLERKCILYDNAIFSSVFAEFVRR